MKKIIVEKLKSIEAKENFKILFAVESGSRAWGFESVDSDYDVRFVYIHKKDWYLSIENHRDVYELPIEDNLDINGWEARKALNLFAKSNPPLLEWLKSPFIYIDSDFRKELLDLEKTYFSPKSSINHYLHMAEGNYKAYLNRDFVKLKKYFYVLRPIFAAKFIIKYNSSPPMVFEDLMNRLNIDSYIIKEINTLLIRKRSGIELGEEKQIKILNSYIAKELRNINDYSSNHKHDRKVDREVLNELFRKYLPD